MTKIVFLSLDGDSSMSHPVTKEKLKNSNESYILKIENDSQFITDIIENNFDLSKKVHESIINMIEYHSEYEDSNFLNLDIGYYDFGNYGIEVIDADSINTL